MRKRYQADQSEMCASFLAMLPVVLACLFGNFGKRDLHWVIGRARIKFRGGLNCVLSDQASKAPLGFVDVYSAFRRQVLLLQLNTR